MCRTADRLGSRTRARATRQALLGLVAGVSLAASLGCAPCEVDGDCGDGSYCSVDVGQCTKDCIIVSDCPSLDQSCTEQGRCIHALAPAVTFVSPAPGAEVEGTFDVELEVLWVGAEVNISLTRHPDAPGEDCAAFTPFQTVLYGDPQRETRQRVVIPNVATFGEGGIRLRASAWTNDTNDRHANLDLVGTLEDGIVRGAEIGLPAEGLVERAPSVSVGVDMTLPFAADRVWAHAVTDRDVSTPRSSIAVMTDRIEDARVPIAVGPQMLELEIERGGARSSCFVGLNTPPATHNRLELALFFESDVPSDLDLWVYAMPDEDEADVCTAHDLFSSACLAPFTSYGLRHWGEEAVQLEVKDGVYGIAIAPGAVSAGVHATVRVTRGDNPIGWLGPRTVLTDAGAVWLAARVYVIGGAITVEPLDAVSVGLPGPDPSAW